MRWPLVVVPAAGKGARMGDLCKDTAKCLLEVNGKPILEHVVRFWRPYAERFCVVTSGDAAIQVEDLLNPLVASLTVVKYSGDGGVPDGVLWALHHTWCPPSFVVVLGDCLFDGTFNIDDLNSVSPGPGFCGMAVSEQPESEWGRSYVADLAEYDEVSGVRVRGVIEKPNLGLGAFWLNWQAIPALERTRNKSITDTFAELVTEGHLVFPVRFSGSYRNVNLPEDLRSFP